jgi:hypothetical protein
MSRSPLAPPVHAFGAHQTPDRYENITRKNVVAFNIRHQGILMIDKDLVQCVAEEVNQISLPFETAQDQEL